MKFIKKTVSASKEEVLNMLSDNERVNERVRFDEKDGTPHMTVKEKKGRVIITCEMLGRPTKDNEYGYLVGTYFSGRITEKDGVTTLRGTILTAPIYHSVMITLVALVIIQAIIAGAITPVPIFAVLFELVLFSREFKKQGYIYRYINRAFKRLVK